MYASMYVMYVCKYINETKRIHNNNNNKEVLKIQKGSF